MIKLLKRMRKREALMALLCAVLVVAQVYFDLKLPDYMTRLTTLIKTPGSVTADILSVGGQMLLCTLASAVLAVGCGYLAAKTASGFSFSVRADLFHHVMDAGSEEVYIDVLRELTAAGRTALISTHHLGTVERLADSVALLNGRLVAHGPVTETTTPQILSTLLGARPPAAATAADHTAEEALP